MKEIKGILKKPILNVNDKTDFTNPSKDKVRATLTLKGKIEDKMFLLTINGTLSKLKTIVEDYNLEVNKSLTLILKITEQKVLDELAKPEIDAKESLDFLPKEEPKPEAISEAQILAKAMDEREKEKDVNAVPSDNKDDTKPKEEKQGKKKKGKGK